MYLNRREDILKLLIRQSNMTTKDLADQLRVSEMTIRRDLSKMEAEGLVRRVFGGVILGEIPENQIRLKRSFTEVSDAKIRMAEAAASMIEDGDSVILDSGTTIEELARHLSEKRIHIATSSLRIAAIAGGHHATIHVSGGEYQYEFQEMVGRTAEDFYDTINCRYAFISAGGVSLKNGLTDYTQGAASLKCKMLAHAKVGVLVADSSKLGTIQMFRALPLEDIDVFVTDCMPPEEYVRFFEENGIELEIADAPAVTGGQNS